MNTQDWSPLGWTGWIFLQSKGLSRVFSNTTNLDSVLKNQTHHSADKSPSSQSYGFTSSHVWMWELDQKEDWTLKNWCFQIIVLGKTLESPLDVKENKSVYF